MRDVRRRIPADEQATRARRVAELVGTLPWWPARRVAVTTAFDGELDLAPVASAVRAGGGTVLVPVLDGDRLRFAAYDDTTTWAPNRYGIDEPVGVALHDASELDVVLVPAVAVDVTGHRIGMGGGFYDRTFAWLRDVPRPATTVLVGVVHDEQVVERIEPAEWDVALDAVVTPERVVLVASGGGGAS